MRDLANSLAASVQFPYDELDHREDSPEESRRGDTREALCRVLSYITSKTNCRLTIDCLLLALGSPDLEGETMTSIAAKRGCTKAAVSKRVKQIRRDLRLPINFNNKPLYAARTYATTNRSSIRIDLVTARRVPSVPSGAATPQGSKLP